MQTETQTRSGDWTGNEIAKDYTPPADVKARKLASVQQILALEPIEDADQVELAYVLGWEVVVRKGLYKKGDLVAYIEVDSVVPLDHAAFEFLKQGTGKNQGRIKTKKIRGQVSQGLIVPLSELRSKLGNFFAPALAAFGWYDFKEGQDLTQLLRIEKHDPEAEKEQAARLGGKIRNWPVFLHKTDEVRVQLLGWLLEKYKGKQLYVTEKLDGSSMTVYLSRDRFGVCSRNFELSPDEVNQFWKTARALKLEEKMREYKVRTGFDLCLQGELVGPGIQKNKYQLKDFEFRIYNIFDPDLDQYFDRDFFFQTAAELGLTTVPDLGTITVGNDVGPFESVKDFVEYSKGFSALNPTVMREGVVFRPLAESTEKKLGRVSFKAINPDFLLKHGD